MCHAIHTMSTCPSIVHLVPKYSNSFRLHVRGYASHSLPPPPFLLVVVVAASTYAYISTRLAGCMVCCGWWRLPWCDAGPTGLGASFNRKMWAAKGKVLSTEMRAFSNANGHRGMGSNYPGHPSAELQYIGTSAFGPNLNIIRDPRYGRNNELPGKQPPTTTTTISVISLGSFLLFPSPVSFLHRTCAHHPRKCPFCAQLIPHVLTLRMAVLLLVCHTTYTHALRTRRRPVLDRILRHRVR